MGRAESRPGPGAQGLNEPASHGGQHYGPTLVPAYQICDGWWAWVSPLTHTYPATRSRRPLEPWCSAAGTAWLRGRGVDLKGSQRGALIWHFCLGCGAGERHAGARRLAPGKRTQTLLLSSRSTSLPGSLRGDAPKARGSRREPARGQQPYPSQQLPSRPGPPAR